MIDFLFLTEQGDLQATLQGFAKTDGMTCCVLADFDEALQEIGRQPIRYIFVDIDEPRLRGLQFLEWLQTVCLPSVIGIVSANPYHDNYLKALHLGVTQRLSLKQTQTSALFQDKLLQLIREDEQRRHLFLYQAQADTQGELIWAGAQPTVRALVEQVRLLAQTELPVLITGNTGVGKKHLARLLGCEKDNQATMVLHAGQTPDYEQKAVLQSALEALVHNTDKPENLKCCLLVFECDRLHPEVQEFIADYLKEGFLVVQGQELFISMQVVMTLSQDLDFVYQDGFFREDLYYIFRNNKISLPLLTQRQEDVVLLANYFFEQQLKKSGFYYLSQDALTALMQYNWPENLTELFAVLQDMVAQNSAGMLSSHMLPNKILEMSFYTASPDDEDLSELSYNDAKQHVLSHFNAHYIKELLEKSDYNLTVAAERAGMDRSNFKKIIKKYGLI